MSDAPVLPQMTADTSLSVSSSENIETMQALRMLALSQVHGFGSVRLKSFTEQIQQQTGCSVTDETFWLEVIRTLPYLIKAQKGLTECLKRLEAPFTVHWPERDQILHWLQHDKHRLICLGQEAYPWLLQQIPDPPAVLFLAGNAELLHLPQLAIVGSRKPTASGFNDARQFAQALAELGWTITSGLADGIDASAHQGALQVGGATVAVLGTGIDRVYPARNKGLFEQIWQQGVLVSEYPLGTPPRGPNFPKRNRIVSGLSVGVLVVEAALKSGSLISARLAAEQDREVFAIPGSIHQPQNKGCHQLIKQGAKLTENVEDIHAELQHWFKMACDPESGTLNAMYRPEQACLFPSTATSTTPVVPAADGEEKTADKPNPIIASGTSGTESPAQPHAESEPFPEIAEQYQPLIAAIRNGAGHVDALVMATELSATEIQTQLLMLELQGVLVQKEGLYQLNRG
ncbi:DNA-processing protein DprA [Oceanospirillum sediminis]|uniref:DNA-protecting protein DprA n=1 Tax=Oceanospirillum sediminis TaxID=2760088 RepID=A0A839IWL0_9GAMM|nr:DNA-processing protein DprA [Oceanospirillum sediminis]MBB1489351.1 DNA-protecting protein DprA [Oceanospirillum sediminis]